MTDDLEQRVRHEIEDLHRFFVDWYAGSVAPEALESEFVPRFDAGFIIITPDGNQTTIEDLTAAFRKAHGANSNHRIVIRDVAIRHELGDLLLVTYTEWQTGSRSYDRPKNARLSTALLTRTEPFRWLHVHETWLPQEQVDGGDFEF